MKKLFLFFIFLLFANPNLSFAKLIEFEKCYKTNRILKENSDDKEDIKNIKWREDFYNFKNVSLYVPFDKNKLDKIIKIGDDQYKLIDHSSVNFYNRYLNNKELNRYLKLIKEYESQGYQKIKYYDKEIYSISTDSGIITETTIITDDGLKLSRDGLSYANESEKKAGRSKLEDWTEPNKIENTKYKIDNYGGGIVQATQILTSKEQRHFLPKKLVINLQDNTIMVSNFRGSSGREKEFFNNYICKSLSGASKKNNYTQYWWAIILIAAVIFFIYTQTGRELKIKK